MSQVQLLNDLSVPQHVAGGGQREAEQRAAQSHSVQTSKARLVVLDDEPLTVRITCKYLRDAGYQFCRGYTDPVAAYEHLAAEPPDLLLLDLIMPGINGLQILARIRNHVQLAHMPVIILTASNDPGMKRQALELSATDFLQKPVDPSELVLRVRNTLIVKAHQDHLAGYARRLESEVQARTRELEDSRLQLIHCLARAAEFRDTDTGRHA